MTRIELKVKTSFALSGGGDIAIVVGRVEIKPGSVIPEPTSGALLAVGFVLAATRRYRR